MSKGYTVVSVMKQPHETVINESLIRDCIYFPPTCITEEERLRFVGAREESQRQKRVKSAMDTMELYRVATLLASYRRIGKIENLVGLCNLTKLALDNNSISTICNLGHLKKLQWLDLSFNQITKICGLEDLAELETLSLFSNKITVVEGLEANKKLVSLSLGNNCIEGLEETARYLHQMRSIRILTLKGNRVEKQPHYKVRLLAFVPTLQFLDGRVIRPEEIVSAREEQRENLVPIDGEDERAAEAAKVKQESEKARKDYEQFNCPDENKFYDELFYLESDGRGLAELLQVDIIASLSKDLLEKYQTEFMDKAKELAEAMKAIRAKRDDDEIAFNAASDRYKQKNADACKAVIKQFEKEVKAHIPRARWGQEADADGVSAEVVAQLETRLRELRHQLLEKEADQYDALEALNAGTIAKWKGDGVDVVLQTAFEIFMKMEADFQVSLRQLFDSLFDKRQKQENSAEPYHHTKQDESVMAIIDNKEEYQKILGDWFELRRKRLEELEQIYVNNEDKLLRERSTRILSEEQSRHRSRLNEIHEFVEQMKSLLGHAW
ncbi:putative leucine-rich repeat protein [Trypanosoma rangeli]|uniref:Dynein regulatory complex subunit 3 n=1 Tax=Trypanosoma rangeli TaxID=5698 RepID=A0A422NMM2_TRYRA|nr:putative leucine-rich repeat protein [Trypanosoma rangeli]RNF06629.1 putative leucine-rich repeat protein [Trypanosoma rangeli]|eukprot:RNF06629.1 putative leucine-rich repeat protein [Trypanosoma rangeli]